MRVNKMTVTQKREYVERNLEYFSSNNLHVNTIFIDQHNLHDDVDTGGDESVDYIVASALLSLAIKNELNIKAVNDFHKANITMRKKLTKIVKSVKGEFND